MSGPRTWWSAVRGRAAADGGGQAVQERVENATAVIWKTLLVAEQSFHRLDAPELLRHCFRCRAQTRACCASREAGV